MSADAQYMQMKMRALEKRLDAVEKENLELKTELIKIKNAPVRSPLTG